MSGGGSGEPGGAREGPGDAPAGSRGVPGGSRGVASGLPGALEESRRSPEGAEALSKLPKGSPGVLPGCPRLQNVRLSYRDTTFSRNRKIVPVARWGIPGGLLGVSWGAWGAREGCGDPSAGAWRVTRVCQGMPLGVLGSPQDSPQIIAGDSPGTNSAFEQNTVTCGTRY